MRIAIIGSGQVGRALMSALESAHDVRFAGRDDAAATARWSEVVILAVPWGAALEVVRGLGDLGGRVLIDATNPMEMRDGRLALATGVGRSGVEMIAEAAPTARLVKAFNQTGADNMARAGTFGTRPVMFVAGDEAGARATAMTLVDDAGFEALDGGPLAASRELEALAMLWIRQAFGGRRRNWAFTIETRGETP